MLSKTRSVTSAQVDNDTTIVLWDNVIVIAQDSDATESTNFIRIINKSQLRTLISLLQAAEQEYSE